MTFLKKALPATLLLVVAAAAGNAQQPATELDPVTITSSFSPLSASKTGRNILVIPGARFQKLAVSSVEELLRYVPGVEVQARGPMGAQSDIVMRGGTFQQVLVLVDGLRINDPFSGHFSAYFPVVAADIERIEVLKGASAALYGSEAVGGVIHIITKTFSASSAVPRFEGSAQASGGSYGLANLQGGGVYHQQNTTIGGGVISTNADGPQQRGITGFFHATTASLGWQQKFKSGLRLFVRSAFDDRNFAAQNFYTTFVSDTARERVRSSWNQAILGYERGTNSYGLNIGYKFTTDYYSFNPGSVANNNKSGLGQIFFTQAHRFSSRIIWTNAAQAFFRRIRSNDRGNHTESQLALVSTAQFTGASGITLVPALRFDWQSRRGFEAVPQLAVSWRHNALQLRASGGKTIRDADFTERYNNYNKPYVASGRIGNPDLESERAWAWDAGADYFLTKELKVSGSFFQRFHTGIIDYVTTAYAQMPRRDNLSPAGTYALAENIAQLTITGAELDLQYSHQFNGTKNQVFASAGFTWADAKSATTTTGFYLSSFAKYLLNFQGSYTAGRFVFGVNGLYKQRVAAQSATAIKAELSKDYFVVHAKAQFFVLPSKLGVFVQADNLFDTKYSDLLGASMPGRWWQFGAHYKF